MKSILARIGFALLKRAGASIQWPDTSKVPGLFAPEWAAARYNFATGMIEVRVRPPKTDAAKALGSSEWVAFNFSYLCPPFCE